MKKICPLCHNKGFIIHNEEYIKCSCITENDVVKALAVALENLSSKGQYEEFYALYQVAQFLPEYPVMAALEAEYQKLDKGMISLLRNSFCVLPLS